MLFLNTFSHCGDKCFWEFFGCKFIKHLLNLWKNSQNFEFFKKLKKKRLIVLRLLAQQAHILQNFQQFQKAINQCLTRLPAMVFDCYLYFIQNAVYSAILRAPILACSLCLFVQPNHPATEQRTTSIHIIIFMDDEKDSCGCKLAGFDDSPKKRRSRSKSPTA